MVENLLQYFNLNIKQVSGPWKNIKGFFYGIKTNFASANWTFAIFWHTKLLPFEILLLLSDKHSNLSRKPGLVL